MTIKKLIEKLSKYDENFEVGQSDDFGYYVEIEDVSLYKSIFTHKDGKHEEFVELHFGDYRICND